MTDTLRASVGEGGFNDPDDVRLVQRLLKGRGFDVGDLNGIFEARLRTAIITFQSGFIKKPDGRIDPGGRSWRRLTTDPAAQPAPAAGNSLTRLVAIPDLSTVNRGLMPVNNQFMTEKLGAPRTSYSADCQPLTNAKLARNVLTASVGPFRVSGLSPAVLSLQAVCAEIQRAQPDVHAVLGTAGMLCCRYVRGSTTSISNHSWGTAVDIKINNVLDARGNGRVQYGLTLIAPIFNQFGWYWGATFHTEDGMHFEAGRALVETWAAQLV